MANFFSKIKLPTAVDKRTHFDLSCDHVTTMDWFSPKISYIKEMVPNESIEVKQETFTRLAPMTVPTFGRINMVHRAFFVPMRTIWRGWNSFITNTVNDINGLVHENVPYTNNNNLITWFISNTNTPADTDYCKKTPDASPHDFLYTMSNGNTQAYVLTKKGRRIIDRLQTLGIRINWMQEDTTKVSLLPILCWWKLINDWYYNTQYQYDKKFDTFMQQFYNASSATVENYANISYTRAKDIMDALSFEGYYDQDYFTSAWTNPNGPNRVSPITSGISVGNVNMSAEDVNNAVQIDSANQAVLVAPTSTVESATVLSQTAIDALKHLSDFLKRYQLVGSKSIDRYLARFGVNLTSEKLNRAVYIGKNNTPIQIGDVMSQSDTSGAVLGDYAGKGLGYSNEGFSYSTDEFGYFVIVSQILPKVGYVEGVNRCNLHIKPQDFYTPEFDSVGTQAIAARELLVSTEGTQSRSWAVPDKVFGYTPRYAEYKIGRDNLSGDYVFNTRNQGEDSWYTFRKIDYSTCPSFAGMTFVGSSLDGDQYNRIFNATTDDADHFRVIMHFDVKDSAPMSSLYDNYEFCEKGKEVTLDINGTNLNGTN